jgi:hypothetical protein
VDGAFEHAGVGHIKLKTFGFEQSTGRLGLGHPRGGEVNIGPPGEAVFQIPSGFAVAKQDKLVHGL